MVDNTYLFARKAKAWVARLLAVALVATLAITTAAPAAHAQDAGEEQCTEIFGGPVTPSKPITQTECDALVAFYNALDGDNWTGPPSQFSPDARIGWDASDPCVWPTVESRFGSTECVTWLSLTGSGLAGEIPAQIGDLVELERVFLSRNNITGEIPAEIFTLADLTSLYLNNNDGLSGDIAQIANLTKLTDSDLSFNNISGSIPAGIGDLTDLQLLILNDNNLSGVVPDEIASLPFLSALDLSNNGCLVASAATAAFVQGIAFTVPTGVNGPECDLTDDALPVSATTIGAVINVLSNDVLAEVAPIDSVTIIDAPSFGTATVRDDDNAIVYIPATTPFIGVDTFTYEACSLAFCDTATVTLTFADNEAPVITTPDDITVTAVDADGTVVTFADATATDNVDGAVTATCAPASGTVFPIGTTIVTCTAADNSGNFDRESFTITVEPIVIEPPVVISTPRTAISDAAAELDSLEGLSLRDQWRVTSALWRLRLADADRGWADDAMLADGSRGRYALRQIHIAARGLVRSDDPAIQAAVEDLVDQMSILAENRIAAAEANNGDASDLAVAQDFFDTGVTQVANGELRRAARSFELAVYYADLSL